ncbi:MAG: TetR/AcrR family transcriptional regulator [Planctomycetota bacterium]|jgi:AcrR family transcriptional regulator|nr:TetR/AcrR family transcriptional regulator [Planctomycetota bacterium]
MPKYENLREQILAHARNLLLEGGPGGVSMRKVANLIGCAPTSIYLYFESKDDLIYALIDEGMENLHQQIGKCMASAADAATQFRMMCRSFLDFGFSNPEYYEIMFQLPTDKMARFPADKYRRARNNLQQFAEVLAVARRPQKSPEDPLVDATMVWSLLHGATSLFLAQRIDSTISKQKFVDRTVEHAFSMLQNNNPSQ